MFKINLTEQFPTKSKSTGKQEEGVCYRTGDCEKLHYPYKRKHTSVQIGLHYYPSEIRVVMLTKAKLWSDILLGHIYPFTSNSFHKLFTKSYLESSYYSSAIYENRYVVLKIDMFWKQICRFWKQTCSTLGQFHRKVNKLGSNVPKDLTTEIKKGKFRRECISKVGKGQV